MSSEKPEGPLDQQLRRLRSIDSPGDLTGRQRTVVKFAVALVSVISFYALVYNVGMATLEGDDQTIFRSFQTVVETMTTTGYGADSPWETPYMNALVIWYQISGVVIGFVTLRILIIPLFERAPVVLDERLSAKDEHVVVCEYGRGKDVLLDELAGSGVEYVIVDSDKQEAIDLSNRGYQAIDGDPTETATLERASVAEAAFVVADARDRNASITLTARQLTDDARVICLTETPGRREALCRIGADRVVCPPALIGRRLAEKATTFDRATSGEEIGDGVVVRDLVVRRGGPLHGTTVGETAVAGEPHLTPVAAWIDGELRLPPAPTDRLPPNSVLVVVGPEESFDAIRAAVVGVQPLRQHTAVVVAGFGEGGRAAVGELPDGADVTTIDAQRGVGSDIVGDASDRATLAEAGIDEATALLVTVDDDETALLITAIGRALTDDIEIFVRVTDAESVPKAFDAGADYALSEQRVSARLLTADISGEDALHPIGGVRFARIEDREFGGRRLGSLADRSDRGWVAVGVERDGVLETDDATEIAPGDTIVVAGTDERLRDLE